MRKWFFIAIVFLLVSCDKNKNEWQLQGKITDALTGNAMSSVPVKVEVKRMVSGVYNDVIETAATATSEANGHYEVKWDRDNISYLRVTAQEDLYFDAIVEIGPDNLNPGEFYTQNLKLTPRSDVEVLLGSSDIGADVKVTFYSTDPYCTCDDQGTWRILGNQDTTIHCMTSGGKWMKYKIDATGSNGTFTHWDSLYCVPFVTTPFTYIY
jgi:hypothetical protein